MFQVPFALAFLPAPACRCEDVLSVLLSVTVWLQIPSSSSREKAKKKKKIQEGFAAGSSPCSAPRCDVPATELSPAERGPASTRSRSCRGLGLRLRHHSGFGAILW